MLLALLLLLLLARLPLLILLGALLDLLGLLRLLCLLLLLQLPLRLLLPPRLFLQGALAERFVGLPTLLLLLTRRINLLALLVALKPLLVALRLLDGLASGVGPTWLHRQRCRIGVAVPVPQRLFAQCALPEGFASEWALRGRAVLLLAREFSLLAAVLGARALFGVERAPVRRCSLLRQGGRNNLRGLAGPGLLAQAFSRPGGAGVARRVVLARFTSVITSVLTSVIAPVIALAGWLQLAGHDGPHGDGSGRQRSRAGHPGQVAQARQA